MITMAFRIKTKLYLCFPGAISHFLLYGSYVGLAIEPVTYTGDLYSIAWFNIPEANAPGTSTAFGKPAAQEDSVGPVLQFLFQLMAAVVHFIIIRAHRSCNRRPGEI